MVWTLPIITNTQLSNIKIFNNGVPTEIILEPQVQSVKQNEPNILKISGKQFIENMSSEIRQLFEIITNKNKSETISFDTIIKKYRLLYIGAAIIITSFILWFLLLIFSK